MHVRIISSDTFRRVYSAGRKKSIDSKRWLKHDETEICNCITLLRCTTLHCLQSFNFRTVYKQAIPQSPAAAIVWFQTAKNKNTKQSNLKTNMNETAFCGVESIGFMTFEAGTTKPRSATWQTKGCDTITEASCTYGTDEICCLFEM